MHYDGLTPTVVFWNYVGKVTHALQIKWRTLKWSISSYLAERSFKSKLFTKWKY